MGTYLANLLTLNRIRTLITPADANAPTLWRFDDNGYMVPMPNIVTPPEMQAVYDEYNDLRRPMDLIERQVMNDFLKNYWLITPPLPLDNKCRPLSPIFSNTPDPLVKTVKYVPYVDPLILDLDGDGLEITRLNGIDSIKFDTNGDGVKTATAWAGPDDGFVVLDRNGNGTIDAGSELFGDETYLANGQKATDGFAALADLDTNHNGSFDYADAQFGAVRIWRDLNQDGISQANELKTLNDSGVSSIRLSSVASGASYPDAQLVREGQFYRTGTNTPVGQAGSFLLAQDNFYTEFSTVPLTPEAAALPDIGGSGKVRDLREAASQSPELVGKLHAVENASTHAGFKQAVADLMLAWGNDSGYQSASKGALANGYGLILSEPLDAQEAGWMNTAVKATADARNAFRATLSAADLTKFDAMRERMVGDLERIAAYEAFTGFTFLGWSKVENDAFHPNYTVSMGQPVEVYVPLSQVIASQRVAVLADEAGYIRVIVPPPVAGEPHITTLWNRLVDDATTNLMPSLRLSKYLDAVNLNINDLGVQFDFSAMDAMIAAVQTSSHYEGTALLLDLERVYSASLDPLGWTGNAQMRVLLQQASTDLDTRRAFTDSGYAMAATSATSGTAGKDGYIGDANANGFSAGDGDDLLDGGAGNDVLQGGLGHDRIFGGDGNDTLYGDDGDDTLDGGAGNDVLNGGLGNNVYLFGKGDGQDRISGYDSYDASTSKLSTVQFKSGVAPSEVIVKQVYDNWQGGNQALELSIAGTTDKFTINGFFYTDNTANPFNGVQQVRFADGTTWDMAAIKAKLFAGTDGNDSLRGTVLADAIAGGLGDDSLNGAAGDDSVDGGAGNDALFGEAGIDSLLGGAGNDTLDGGADNDTLDGGAGNDVLNGGLGNNVYLFGKGDGQDRISGYDSYDASTSKLSTVQFKSGVAPSEVIVKQVYDNWQGGNQALELSIAGTTDKFTINGFFYTDNTANPFNGVQQVRFADGTTWDMATIQGMLATNVLSGTAAAETLTGSALADQLNGLDGNDTLFGAAGNDWLDGGSGSDVMKGGAGNDVYVVDASGDSITELTNEGIDTVRSSVTWALGAELENLVLTGATAINGTGNTAANRLFGNSAANVLNGASGADVLVGGAGNDTYVVDDAGDSIVEFALEGTDAVQASLSWTLTSNVENLTLTGTTAINGTGNELNNSLTGNSAVNTLVGGAGNDSLNGAAGADTLIGGTGDDTYTVDNVGDLVTESANEGTDLVSANLTWTLAANLENLTLTGGTAINGTGNALDNVLAGNTATNVLTGGGGNDTYVVGTGDTTIENANEGIDTVQSNIAWTLAANVDNLTLTGTTAINATGNSLDNLLTGNSAANVLTGGAGNDTYVVGTGDTTIEAANEGIDAAQSSITWTLAANVENLLLTGASAINATGNSLDNLLTGNSANNTLTGSSGNDTLDGGLGNDTMIGGTGNDTYVTNVTTDVITENANEGIDAVQSAVTYTLSANLENLTLTGTSAINGTGNAIANTLIGNTGVNTLAGAEGNDIYDGGAGNDAFSDTSTTSSDTYRWGVGVGSDTLTDAGGTLDHVDLFAGITKAQLKFVKNVNNLELSVIGQADKLVINNWYTSSANQIEEFRLTDGSKVLASEVAGLLSAMAVFDAPASLATSGRMRALPAGRCMHFDAPLAATSGHMRALPVWKFNDLAASSL
jgi:Ca2+-binding RTX toxin-like protein